MSTEDERRKPLVQLFNVHWDGRLQHEVQRVRFVKDEVGGDQDPRLENTVASRLKLVIQSGPAGQQ